MQKRMRLLIFFTFALVPSLIIAPSLVAVPLLPDSNYSIEQVASGLGAVTGIAIGPMGDIYTADYQGGNIYRIDQSTYDVYTYATGLSYSTDITFDNSGSMFVTSGSGNPRDILQINSNESVSLFASGFTGKPNPPVIGPSGLEFFDTEFRWQ